ncbi:hypothetical protein [Rubellicoccus peritrichatus]|uniref:Uncharacterized protein n=1 Tax=Rubellicoccus peritrichatus TaxID=3080537 RepID=A0AAQ3L863_9BACT|nr:hypothetical protein [Puniceicoccus sp. CR14]WOO41075.1 hypothetical protein RZN69_20845 [Puniceicoccus sp. CR14]
MKASHAIVMMLLATCLSSAATPLVETGANKSEIYKQMGPPDGILELPSKTVLMYQNAELTLVDGILTASTWKTDEEVALETAHQEKVKADWDRYQETLAAERHETGLAILKRKKNDPAFLKLPGRDQARFWRDFTRDYPSVDASEQFEAAIVVAQAEANLAQEQAALYAESQAQQQKPFTTTTSLIDTVDVGGYAYNGGYFYPPYSPTVVAISPSNTVVVGGGNYCPPVKTRPILNVGYKSNNFGVSFSSGGGTYGRPCIYPQPRPVVIVNP